MEKSEKDKLLDLMAKEYNSYAQFIGKEEARLKGKLEGMDYMLGRLNDYLHNEVKDDEQK